jgi:hypothetical protein
LACRRTPARAGARRGGHAWWCVSPAFAALSEPDRRYILRSFGYILALVFASGVSLLVITDLTENIDEILTHRPAASIVLRYYKYLSLELAYEIAPIVVLVTTLVTFSLLSRTNEVVACRALGISVYRLGCPAAAAMAWPRRCTKPVLRHRTRRSPRPGDDPQRNPKRDRGADRQWQMRAEVLYNFLH